MTQLQHKNSPALALLREAIAVNFRIKGVIAVIRDET